MTRTFGMLLAFHDLLRDQSSQIEKLLLAFGKGREITHSTTRETKPPT